MDNEAKNLISFNKNSLHVCGKRKSKEFQLYRKKVTDPGWNVNELFDQINEEESSSGEEETNNIRKEINEIKAKKFKIPKRNEINGIDPKFASRYVKVLMMLTK